MTKDRFLLLHQQFSKDTAFLSFLKYDHPAIQELSEFASSTPANKQQVILWCLERLQPIANKEEQDSSNNPFLSFHLLHLCTNDAAFEGFPPENAGKVVLLAEHLFDWGRKEWYCK